MWRGLLARARSGVGPPASAPPDHLVALIDCEHWAALSAEQRQFVLGTPPPAAAAWLRGEWGVRQVDVAYAPPAVQSYCRETWKRCIAPLVGPQPEGELSATPSPPDGPLRVQLIDHVAIGVRSQRDSLLWYRGVLGMEQFLAKHPHFDNQYVVMIRGGGAVLALLQLPDGEQPLNGSREQRGHAAVRVSPAEFQRFRRLLPELLEKHRLHPEQSAAIQEQDYGLQLSLFFYDPDGNELEVTTWVDEDDPVRFG
eukprot:TRINITY_DN60820_c0_g1_i1.p1 TRINITY_DN60820_c0_g1~~TRINITY_DN60820_c0_g1_i1.p1  ORF type:complete len:281 (+),score=101.03 TRINITY_DN60820_c0_g1_i1:83-844(+)